MAETKITNIIESSLEKIKEVVDANTIIGEPISTPGGTVIPVSKIMVGFASGGVDYPQKQAKRAGEAQKDRPLTGATNFGGGGGTGVTVQPVGFLVVSNDGNVQLLNVGQGGGSGDKIDSIANIIERSPDIIAKIKALFEKKENKEEK